VWLVRGLLGAGEFSCIFGAPGSGKSVLVGDLAAHVAAGLDWFGREVSCGGVLYVAAERAALVKRRFAAWRLAKGLSDLPLAVLEGSVDLRNGQSTSSNEIIAAARDLAEESGQAITLTIVDTASRALAGGDENSPKDMGALVGHLSAIQQATGSAVLVVHHIPQDGSQRLRGHGALLGAIDTSIGVEKHAEQRTATVDKANDSEEGERITFTLESIEIADDGTTAPIVVPSSRDPRADAARPARRLPDRSKAALDVLNDLCIDGKPLPPGYGLPDGIRAVPVVTWRDQLTERGVIGGDDKNPRATFDRIKTQLLARQMVGERNAQIWAVTP
jgi:hypothetical protein